VVPPKIEERFLPSQGGSGRLLYRPALLGAASVHYANARAEVDEWLELAFVADLGDAAALRDPWKQAQTLAGARPTLEAEPAPGADFAELPAKAAQPESYASWSKMLQSHVYKEHSLNLWRCRELGSISKPGETEGEFSVRLRQRLHERRDLEVEKLRKRFAPRLARLQERIRTAEERVAVQKGQYDQQKLQTAVSLGATVLGALFGRKLGSAGNVGRAATTVRGAGRTARERDDVARAAQKVEGLRHKLAELEAEFEEAVEQVRTETDDAALEREEIAIRPRKSDLSVDRVTLVWRPWRVSDDGIAEPDFG